MEYKDLSELAMQQEPDMAKIVWAIRGMGVDQVRDNLFQAVMIHRALVRTLFQVMEMVEGVEGKAAIGGILSMEGAISAFLGGAWDNPDLPNPGSVD